MKRFTLYTERYIQKAREFMAQKNCCVHNEEKRGGQFAFYFTWEGGDPAQALMELLEEVALQENPVYRHAPKMRMLARELRSTPLFVNEVNELRQFLRINKYLHIEGYVAFRMGKYCEKLDMVSYSLIKKLNLHRREDWL